MMMFELPDGSRRESVDGVSDVGKEKCKEVKI